MTQIQETAKAIVRLNLWERVAKYNWAFQSQLAVEPFIVVVNAAKEGPIAGRLMFFRGFKAFQELCLLQRFPDYGVAMTPMDIAHEELVGLADGSAELVMYRPGYVPRPFDAETAALYEPVLRECGGFMMRLETEPELPNSYVKDDAFFCRSEGLDGKWRDGPLKTPDAGQVVWTESVALDKEKCARAEKLPLDETLVWEADLLQAIHVHTREERPRFLYLIAAVERDSGEKRLWERISVGAGGLKAIWEGAAGRLLDAMLAFGRIPGEIHVRTPRLMRFIRPLGMQLPFKLVQHAELGGLDRALAADVLLQGAPLRPKRRTKKEES